MQTEKLILIDGNALFYRAFHAIPGLKTSKGELVNAVYGFTSMLLSLLAKEYPEYIAIAWDSKAKTYRHEQFTAYKGTRPPPPEGMYEQLPRLKSLLEAFGIPSFAMDGYEADDLLATICVKECEKNADLRVGIASGDKDLFQLITSSISVLTPEFGFQKYTIYDPEKVQERFQITPLQMIDYKSLVGDPSDNIPGVKGIGPTGAVGLLEKYTTLENIYEHLEEIPGKMREKLQNGKEAAFLSKHLVTLQKEAPLDFDLQKCRTHTFDVPQIERFFQELEFKSLMKKLSEIELLYNEKRQGDQNHALPLIFE